MQQISLSLLICFSSRLTENTLKCKLKSSTRFWTTTQFVLRTPLKAYWKTIIFWVHQRSELHACKRGNIGLKLKIWTRPLSTQSLAKRRKEFSLASFWAPREDCKLHPETANRFYNRGGRWSYILREEQGQEAGRFQHKSHFNMATSSWSREILLNYTVHWHSSCAIFSHCSARPGKVFHLCHEGNR